MTIPFFPKITLPNPGTWKVWIKKTENWYGMYDDKIKYNPEQYLTQKTAKWLCQDDTNNGN